MKKTVLILIVAVVFTAACIGGFLVWRKLTSAEAALNRMIGEVRASGIDALEPHLTGSALTVFEKLRQASRNPVVRLLSVSGLTDRAASVLGGASSSFTAVLKDIRHGSGTASVTLTLSSGSFSEDVSIEMVLLDREWKICDLSVPVTDWIF